MILYLTTFCNISTSSPHWNVLHCSTANGSFLSQEYSLQPGVHMKIAAIGNWKKFSERGDHKEIGLIRQKIMEMPEMRGIMLVQTKYNLKTSGYRAFSHAAPKIWDSMPISLRTYCELGAFKSKHFFLSVLFRCNFTLFLIIYYFVTTKSL